MKQLYPLSGVVTTVLTPFTPSLAIDWQSFRRSIQAALNAGVAGFLVPCFASELKQLSLEERTQMVRETMQLVKGRALVIPNVQGDTPQSRLQQCREYLQMGVSGLNLNMKFTDEEAFYGFVAEIDALHPPFLSIQDDNNEGGGIPVSLIQRLFEEFESFRCIKIEIKGSGPKYTQVLRATDGRLNVCGAWGSDQMMEAYDRGIHALMPSGLYELFVNIYDLYHKKSREAAMKLFFDMLPIIVFTRQSDEVNRAFHKAYLKRIGIFETTLCREPGGFDAYQERYANDLIDYAIQLRSRLAQYWTGEIEQ